MGQGNLYLFQHQLTDELPKGVIYNKGSPVSCALCLNLMLTQMKSFPIPICFRFPVVVFGSPGISTCQATHCICWALTFAFFTLSQVKFGLATGKHVNWYYLFHVGTWGFLSKGSPILEFFFSPLGLTLMADLPFDCTSSCSLLSCLFY